MSILTDIFVSAPEVAPGYETFPPTQTGGPYEVVRFKGITNLELGMLWAIIDGAPFDFEKHALEAVKPPKSEWLFKLPAPFVQKLAALSPTAIDAASAAWAKTEELQWEASEAKEVVVELVRLAKLASSSSKGLYLWGSN